MAKKEKESLRADAYDQILEAIIFGDLSPGSRTDEKMLVRRFGSGLASVRDALFRLSLEGLIMRQPRIGTQVPELGLTALHNVFEARTMIEGGCAALVAERATAQDIAAMRSAFTDYEQAIEQRDFRSLVQMDRKFHRAIAAATQNTELERQIIQLHNISSRFWYFGIRRLDANAVRADIQGHQRVIDAIAKRDGPAATREVRAVLGHFPEDVRLFLAGSLTLTEEHVNG